MFSTTTSSLLLEISGAFQSGKIRVLTRQNYLCILDWNGRFIVVSRTTWTICRNLRFDAPNGASTHLWLGHGMVYIRTGNTIRLYKVYDEDMGAFHVFLVGALGYGNKILRADGDHSIKQRIGKWLV